MGEDVRYKDEALSDDIEKALSALPEVKELLPGGSQTLAEEVARVWNKKNESNTIVLRRRDDGLTAEVSVKVSPSSATKAFGETLQSLIVSVIGRRTEEPVCFVQVHIVGIAE